MDAEQHGAVGNVAQYFYIHPDNPQARLIQQAVNIVREGGVIAYPTDSAYALGCQLDDKAALERLRRIRHLDERHNMTLICRDLSDIATYARVDNRVYRLLKAHTPGAYTFILQATSEVPRRLHHPKRKTVGLRVPDNTICQALIGALGEPLVSTTLILPKQEEPLSDPENLRDALEKLVDLIIDGGHTRVQPTSVIDLSTEDTVILREGAGDLTAFR